jgi:hypothetical protein
MQRMSPFPLPHVTAAIAPEDVELPVGRRREAHGGARGGAGAGGRQRRPGVGRRAEAVHVVAEGCVYVCVCHVDGVVEAVVVCMYIYKCVYTFVCVCVCGCACVRVCALSCA